MARARGSHAAGMAELRQATADLGAQLAQIEETFAEVLPREARNISRRAIVAVAREVRDDIRSAAPVDEGTLRKAVRSRREKGGKDRAEAGIRITEGAEARHDAFHWRFVEFGTQYIPPVPFILPTIKAWRPKVGGAFVKNWWPQFEREMAKRDKRA